MPLTRRDMLGLGFAAATVPFAQPALAQRFVNRTGLEAGQYVWEPSRPTTGAVQIIASRLERLVHVYKDGTLIGVSTCEIGDGRRTPMGIFTLSDRRDESEASRRGLAADDDDARDLVWPATPLHGVNLNLSSPDCVRVPTTFARLLSSVAQPGSLLVVTDRHSQPNITTHTERLLPVELRQNQSQRSRFAPRAFDLTARDDTVAIFISRTDKHAALLRDGGLERRIRITIGQPRSPLGTHVYSLLGADEDGEKLRWLGFGLGRSNREPHLAEWRGNDALDRISIPDRDDADHIARSLHTGATLIVTDLPGGTGWRSPSRDVVVLAATQASATQNMPNTATPVPRQAPGRNLWANVYPDSGS